MVARASASSSGAVRSRLCPDDPGWRLVDAHAHPSVDDDEDAPFLADRPFAKAKLEEYAAHGVTVVRDVGGANTGTLDFARSPMPGRPLVTVAGRFLSAPGRYFPRMYVASSADQLVAAIRAEVGAGAQWIKVIGDFPEWGEAEPLPDSLAMTYDLDTMRAAVEFVHELGARLAVHANLPASDLVAIGVDSFEHGTALTRDDVEALGARGGAWTPTLGAIMSQRDAPDPALRARVAEIRERTGEVLPRAVTHGVAGARRHSRRRDDRRRDRAACRVRPHRRTGAARCRVSRARVPRRPAGRRPRHLRCRPPLTS
jgi:imidazolonepropionase-like amidohydrolase